HCNICALFPWNQQLPQSPLRRCPCFRSMIPCPHLHPPRRPPHSHGIVGVETTPPDERNHCARKLRQFLPHSRPRSVGPVGGDGHGPVLLHPGTAAHGGGPALELRPRRVDRHVELRRLLHRHSRHRPRLDRTQPARLPPQSHRLHRGVGRSGPHTEPAVAGQHPHDRGNRLG